MKLRMNEGSLRLRVRRSEVEAFAAGGAIATTLRFPGGPSLTWQLQAAPVDAIAVEYREGRIDISIPEAQAKAWAAGDEVGLYGRHQELEVMVEKDFRRTSLPSPDDADRYPNPRAACGH